MLRFERELAAGLDAAGVTVRAVRPLPVLNKRFAGRLSKWLGHADKYLLFPRWLRRAVREFATEPAGGSGGPCDRVLVHVLDHSNAIYLPCLGALPAAVTCHDLIAVRSALGEFGVARRPGFTGRLLQHRIIAGLKLARHVACDSGATRDDFLRIIGRPTGIGPRPIYLGIAKAFTPDGGRAEEYSGVLLHVGSGAWYKRRDRVLRVFKLICERRPGSRLAIIGEPLDPPLRQLAHKLGVGNGIIEAGRVSDHHLAEIYRAAGALLFPSEVEGFGWPPLEAMACGCPAVCAPGGSLREVACGPLAFCAGAVDAGDWEYAVAAVRFLDLPPGERARLAAEQAVFLEPFRWEACVASYLDFYLDILESAEA